MTNPNTPPNTHASDFPAANGPSQRQLEQKSFEVNYYRGQAEELQSQMQILQKVLEDIENTKKSIGQMDALQKGALLPIGAGVFAKAKADRTATVLIDIGSRVMAEKTADEAIGILDMRKTMVEKNLADVTAMLEKALVRYEQVSAQAQQMAAQAQQG